MPMGQLDDGNNGGDETKRRVLGIFFSEFATDEEKQIRAGAMLAAIGGAALIRLESRLVGLNLTAPQNLGELLRVNLLPFTMQGRNVTVAKVVGDAVWYLTAPTLIAQIGQWIMGPPDSMPPIPGLSITRGPNGEITLVMPELWLVDP